jgi:hypothetical protein
MAHKLNLAFPADGINYLWNIDTKVGTQVSEPNATDDVALVQMLFGIVLRGGVSGQNAAGSCKSAPNISGNMDHPTAFWIYYAQVEAPGMTADGNLTPSSKSPTPQRLIVRLNVLASKANRIEWENLPNSPQCPPYLKAKLLAPPR